MISTTEPAKHSMYWIVLEIVLRGAVVLIPASFLFFGIAVIHVLFEGLKVETTTPTEALKEAEALLEKMYHAISLASILLSYTGIRWGCRYVAARAHVETREAEKAGYWVGILLALVFTLNQVPFQIPLLFSGWAILLGISLTPRLVKKWLTQSTPNIHHAENE